MNKKQQEEKKEEEITCLKSYGVDREGKSSSE